MQQMTEEERRKQRVKAEETFQKYVAEYIEAGNQDPRVNEKGEALPLKAVYRKLALWKHPDKNPTDPTAATAVFKEINEAYAYLTQPADSGPKETPSWRSVSPLYRETKREESNALTTEDYHKPSVDEFFTSLLEGLDAFQQELENEDEKARSFIVTEHIEGIAPDQQRENKAYVLTCITAAKRITKLLKAFVSLERDNTVFGAAVDIARTVELLVQLNKAFEVFGEDRLPDIRDGHTMRFANFLASHLIFLRNPQRSFRLEKETAERDKFSLDLLSDASGMMIIYSNNLYRKMSKFHEKTTIFGGGKIPEKITHNETLMALKKTVISIERLKKAISENEGEPEIVVRCEQELVRVRSEWAAVLKKCGGIAGLKEVITIRNAYVATCTFQDDLTTFDPDHRHGQGAVFKSESMRGGLRSAVIAAQFNFNALLKLEGITGVEPFEHLGYASFEQFEAEKNGIVGFNKDEETGYEENRVTGWRYIRDQREIGRVYLGGSDTVVLQGAAAAMKASALALKEKFSSVPAFAYEIKDNDPKVAQVLTKRQAKKSLLLTAPEAIGEAKKKALTREEREHAESVKPEQLKAAVFTESLPRTSDLTAKPLLMLTLPGMRVADPASEPSKLSTDESAQIMQVIQGWNADLQGRVLLLMGQISVARVLEFVRAVNQSLLALLVIASVRTKDALFLQLLSPEFGVDHLVQMYRVTFQNEYAELQREHAINRYTTAYAVNFILYGIWNAVSAAGLIAIAHTYQTILASKSLSIFLAGVGLFTTTTLVPLVAMVVVTMIAGFLESRLIKNLFGPDMVVKFTNRWGIAGRVLTTNLGAIAALLFLSGLALANPMTPLIFAMLIGVTFFGALVGYLIGFIATCLLVSGVEMPKVNPVVILEDSKPAQQRSHASTSLDDEEYLHVAKRSSVSASASQGEAGNPVVTHQDVETFEEAESRHDGVVVDADDDSDNDKGPYVRPLLV